MAAAYQTKGGSMSAVQQVDDTLQPVVVVKKEVYTRRVRVFVKGGDERLAKTAVAKGGGAEIGGSVEYERDTPMSEWDTELNPG